jgi:NAD(P)-dependent dehydrogenase (short-subunit alcohol dehydrogenase family)
MSSEKVVLITGASRGIGRRIAIGLADQGHTVIGVSRSAPDLSVDMKSGHGEFFSITGDVSEIAFVERLKSQVMKEHGTVQILINAAGIFGPIDLIQNTNPEEWTQTFMVDVIAPYYMTRAFLPGMLEKGWGRIINVSSAAALHPPGPLNSAYATAKVALNQLTRHIAAEVASSGVTANVIHPGDVRSDMWADIKKKADALGEIGKDYQAWVDWVEKTGGDDASKAMDLVIELVSSTSDSINGRFCWINEPLQAPIASWEDPTDSRPWGDGKD